MKETIYILQNSSLMKQITESMKTHNLKKGYEPTKDQLDEINSF